MKHPSLRPIQLIILTLALAILSGLRASAIIYLQDGFNYPAGSAMYTNSPWSSAILGNTNLAIVTWTNSLGYTNNGTSLQDVNPLGLAVLETNNAGENGQYWCVYDNFPTNPPTDTNLVIYTSFLLNAQPHDFTGMPGAGGGNNEPLNKNCDVMELTCTNNILARGFNGTDLAPGGGTTAWDFMYDSVSNFLGVVTCASGTKSTNWIDGVLAGTGETAWYSNSIIDTNVTYFVVLRYTWGSNSAAGYSPNTVSMYINPTPGAPEPTTPNLVQNSSGAAFGTSYQLGAIILNTPNGNNQRTPIVIGSLRVGSTWADVTPAAAAISANPTFTLCSYVPGVGFTLNGINGPTDGSTYSIWATTNLSTPFASWTQLATSLLFDGSGNFSYADSTATTNQMQYYRLTIP